MYFKLLSKSCCIYFLSMVQGLLFGIEFNDLKHAFQRDNLSHTAGSQCSSRPGGRGSGNDLFAWYGSDQRIADIVRTYPQVKDRIVSFIFPIMESLPDSKPPEAMAYGTINELLPALSKRLNQYNSRGVTKAVVGNDGGHISYHGISLKNL